MILGSFKSWSALASGANKTRVCTAMAQPAINTSARTSNRGGSCIVTSTSRLSAPDLTALSMSVSRRSPTTSGCLAPVRSTDSWCSGGSGLPATSGLTPVAVAITWMNDPFPGWMP